MGRMNDLDLICQDLGTKAKLAIESGEQSEDTSEAVYEEIFNWCGRDPDLREWAMSTADMVLSEVFADVEKNSTMMSKRVSNLMDVLWHLENTGQLESLGTESRLFLLGRMRSVSRNTEDADDEIRSEPGRSDPTVVY